MTIAKSAGTGTVGAVTDHNDGTYTAVVTAPTLVGSGTFTATVNSSTIGAVSVTYTPGAADAARSALTPVTSSVTADGVSTQTLTVQAKDVNGNALTTGGSTVTIAKTGGSGTIGAVTDNNDGTYTADVTAPVSVGSGTFVATLGGSAVKGGGASQTQATVNYVTAAANAAHSTLTPTSGTRTANGTATIVLTVQARDVNDNALASGGDTVTIGKVSGPGSISGVTDHNDGTYTAIVTAPATTGTAVFSATLNGSPVKSGGA